MAWYKGEGMGGQRGVRARAWADGMVWGQGCGWTAWHEGKGVSIEIEDEEEEEGSGGLSAREK